MSVARPASYVLVVANAIVHLHAMHVAGDLDREFRSCTADDRAVLEDFFSSDWMLSTLGSESEPFQAAQDLAATATMDLVRLLSLYDPISSVRVQFATPRAIAAEKANAYDPVWALLVEAARGVHHFVRAGAIRAAPPRKDEGQEEVFRRLVRLHELQRTFPPGQEHNEKGHVMGNDFLAGFGSG
ncbi:hypothetical protein AURDEDRAFT_132078 [Auricularia subglabra TFB-10046 SS5]|uniref:Uncharacterized protein n=1 Tax=Auricularia subglabra (strain TFB-10046 / SS5) TaxID=717982 RepID=J0CQV0_AURST|nr:hypothetical protein AURDEDRAFT_132078 [Auricularia subglabra TFB-10046 SS5]